MRRSILFGFLGMLLLAGCFRRPLPTPPPSEPEGYVKLYLNGQKIFDEPNSTIMYASLSNSVGFEYSAGAEETRLGGAVINLPAVGGVFSIDSTTDNCTRGTHISCAYVVSSTGAVTAPDGRQIIHLQAVEGQVKHPDRRHVEVTGRAVEVGVDPYHPVSYNWKLEIKIAVFE